MNFKNYGHNSGVETGKGAVFITVVALAISLTLPLYGQQTAKDVPTGASGDQQASAGTQQTRQGIVQELDGTKQIAAVTEEAAEPAPIATPGSGALAASTPSGSAQAEPPVAVNSNPDPQDSEHPANGQSSGASGTNTDHALTGNFFHRLAQFYSQDWAGTNPSGPSVTKRGLHRPWIRRRSHSPTGDTEDPPTSALPMATLIL